MTSGTLLLRQVNPSWVQDGRVTSQVFKPTARDERRLSVYDGDQIAAEPAWRHYTESLGFQSVGVLAVSVKECETLELTAESDPKPFDEHAVIDFGDVSTSQIEKKAKRLKMAAEKRGWQYQAEVTA